MARVCDYCAWEKQRHLPPHVLSIFLKSEMMTIPCPTGSIPSLFYLCGWLARMESLLLTEVRSQAQVQTSQTSESDFGSVNIMNSSSPEIRSSKSDRWEGLLHIKLPGEQRWLQHLKFFRQACSTQFGVKASLQVTYIANSFVETAIILHRMFHIAFISPLSLGVIAHLKMMYALSEFLVGVFHVYIELLSCHPNYLYLLWR